MATFFINLDLSIEGESRMPTKRPKLAFRGRDRKRINNLKKALEQCVKMDLERSNDATKNGTPAVLFRIVGNTNVTGAVTQLQNRVTQALGQRIAAQALPAGDQQN